MLLRAIIVSVIDLFNPRIFLMIFVPPIIALVLWVTVGWIFWAQLGQFIGAFFLSNQMMSAFLNWLQEHLQANTNSVSMMLSFLLIFLALFPLVWATALVIASIATTPVVLAHLERHQFPDLKKKRESGISSTVINAFLAAVIFFILWMISIPFWIMTGFGILLPLVITALFNMRVLWFDVLSEHASKAERLTILKENRLQLFGIGILLAFLVTVPLLNFALPIYGTLVFGRYCLGQLEIIRKNQESSVA